MRMKREVEQENQDRLVNNFKREGREERKNVIVCGVANNVFFFFRDFCLSTLLLLLLLLWPLLNCFFSREPASTTSWSLGTASCCSAATALTWIQTWTTRTTAVSFLDHPTRTECRAWCPTTLFLCGQSSTPKTLLLPMRDRRQPHFHHHPIIRRMPCMVEEEEGVAVSAVRLRSTAKTLLAGATLASFQNTRPPTPPSLFPRLPPSALLRCLQSNLCHP